MRILILHNRYNHLGGEDSVVQTEAQHLLARGHTVQVETVDNSNIVGAFSKARAFFDANGSQAAANRAAKWVSQSKPDVVHVHNFFPRLTPSTHISIAEQGVAVVQTLHNFRLICAGALLLRNGAICEDCLGGNAWPALKHRCYRNSLPGTAAVVAMQRATIGSQKWLRSVDQFIALTQFGRDKFIQGGLPAEKIVVKPNFVSDFGAPIPMSNRTGHAIFVGRLSEEKGALDLVQAWRAMPDLPLSIVGDGPQLEMLRAIAPANVSFCGRLPRSETIAAIRNAQVLLFPSRWYEGFPMTLVEAMAAGTPIVAAGLGAAKEILSGQSFAQLYDVDDPTTLTRAVRDLLGQKTDHSAAAYAVYEALYAPAANIKHLEEIYTKAIGNHIPS